MLLPELRARVLHANQEIARRGLAIHTFGNVSAIERNFYESPVEENSLIAIKPSGVNYSTMTASDIVLTTLHGTPVDSQLNASSDLLTHLYLYRAFPQIGGIVHTHSEFATSWAQACKPIPCLGTTHADYFHGEVPVTDQLTASEVSQDYTGNTGAVIARLFQQRGLDPLSVPGVLVGGHAPFAWGKTPEQAVENADLLEYIARLAYRTVLLGIPECGFAAHVGEHHYQRKHGPKSTYGQKLDPKAK